MPLEGHWQRVQAPVPANQRPVLLLGALLAALLVAIVIAASVADTHPAAAAGCKRVTVAMTTGGATIEHCKPPAR